MLEPLVSDAVLALTLYVVLGLLVALPFAFVGVGRVDPHAREGSWGFRLLILPGTVAFWPWLLWRWMRGSGPRQERNAHRDRARLEVKP